MADLLARVRAEQNTSWQRGDAVRVEVYLDRHPELRESDEAILDLICAEMILRHEAGEVIHRQEYYDRFPHLTPRLSRLAAAHEVMADLWPDLPTGSASGDADSEGSEPLPEVQGYRIESEIGRGGRGVVYRATHLALGRIVALKMLRPNHFADETDAKRFRQEARTVAGLRHPNIIDLYDFGESGGQLYFTMELVAGGLDRRLAAGPLPPRDAAALIETLARTLAVVHRQRVIHRDLKPANVLLTEDGIAKLADFGLVKRLDGSTSLTESGAIVGTPAYMAPEQAYGQSESVGPSADVYGLGAILYECLTGVAPFPGNNAMDVLLRVVSVKPTSPGRVRPGVPSPLEAICLRCLSKSPMARYPSAEALADALLLWQQGRWREHPLGPTTRRRVCLMGLAGLVAVAGVPVSPSPIADHLIEREPPPPLVLLDTVGAPRIAPVTVLGRNEQMSSAEDGYRIGATVFCAVQLRVELPAEEFHFEVETRHEFNRGLGRVGLYFAHSEQPGIGGAVLHGLVGWVFSDLGNTAGKAEVSAHGCTVTNGNRSPMQTIYTTPAKRISPVPREAATGPWRKLGVSVHPEGIELFWEGASVDVLERLLLDRLFVRLAENRGDAVSRIASRCALGLIVVRGKACFRNATVRAVGRRQANFNEKGK